jgi:hypothetical protein
VGTKARNQSEARDTREKLAGVMDTEWRQIGSPRHPQLQRLAGMWRSRGSALHFPSRTMDMYNASWDALRSVELCRVLRVLTASRIPMDVVADDA